jgi:putative transposase
VRSLGGWAAVAALRRGREAYLGDERVLGSREFVERLRQTAEDRPPPGARALPLATLVTRVCRRVGIAAAQLPAGSRRAAVTRARDGIAYLWVEVLGRPGRPLAPTLGVRPQAVYQAVMRGRQGGARWEQVLQT